MGFFYDEVVPWGRSFDEYRRMFALTDAELELRILGCADGPASFNAVMAERGHPMVSVDPLYALSEEQIRQRIDVTFQDVIEQTEREKHRFVWREIPSVNALGEIRMRAMDRFLEDYAAGRSAGRYVSGALPDLPATGPIDLALCSHFLFLYSRQLPLDFHIASIEAMLGVAREVRLFPLLDVDAQPSRRVEPVCTHLDANGFAHEIVRVPYEFQKGGDRMLRIWRD